MEDIPPKFDQNWDCTAMKTVPPTNWTTQKKGTNRVEIAVVDDKRHITAVFACGVSGKFLHLPCLMYSNGNALPKSLNCARRK